MLKKVFMLSVFSLLALCVSPLQAVVNVTTDGNDLRISTRYGSHDVEVEEIDGQIHVWANAPIYVDGMPAGDRTDGEWNTFEAFPADDIIINGTGTLTVTGISLTGRSDDLRISWNGPVEVVNCGAETTYHSDIVINAPNTEVESCDAARNLSLYNSRNSRLVASVQSSNIGGGIYVTGTSESDDISITNLDEAPFRIEVETMGGADDVEIVNVAADRLKVYLGDGNDWLTMSSVFVGWMDAYGGRGFDVSELAVPITNLSTRSFDDSK